MAISYPDGTPVACSDSGNVLCLSLNNGLVQYVQVNVNGRRGTYTTVVSAGATKEGTFSFNALAAAPIQAKGLSKRTLALEAHNLQVDLGRTADGAVLAGWLQKCYGRALWPDFSLHDDGVHGDGLGGDGVFGSDTWQPPGRGVA